MKSSKSYLAWVGQNATTGQPHPITGNYSMYGYLHWFPTKKERDEYVEYIEDCEMMYENE